MASPIAAGSAARIALKKETTYGVVPAGTYFLIPAVNWRLAKTQAFQEVDLIGQGRDPGRPERDPVINARGTAQVPIDLRNIGMWLEGLLSVAATSGPNPYTHVFNSGADSLLSYTAEVQSPDLSPAMYQRATGILVNGATLNLQPQGRAYLDLDLLAANVSDETVSIAGGSPTIRPVERFTQAHATIKRAGTDIAKVVSASLPMVNNVEQIYYVGGAGAVGDLIPGLFQARGQIVTRLHPGLTAGLFSDATLGSTFAMVMEFRIDAQRRLTFELDITEVAHPQRVVQGPGGIEVTFDYAASANPGVSPAVTATLVNDVSSY
jgi:Phage tail tube protein